MPGILDFSYKDMLAYRSARLSLSRAKGLIRRTEIMANYSGTFRNLRRSSHSRLISRKNSSIEINVWPLPLTSQIKFWPDRRLLFVSHIVLRSSLIPRFDDHRSHSSSPLKSGQEPNQIPPTGKYQSNRNSTVIWSKLKEKLFHSRPCVTILRNDKYLPIYRHPW